MIQRSHKYQGEKAAFAYPEYGGDPEKARFSSREEPKCSSD